MDKECVDIPDTVHFGDEVFAGDDIPEAFAKCFKSKVSNITQTTTIDANVFNGTEQMQAQEEFFMTELKVREIRIFN